MLSSSHPSGLVSTNQSAATSNTRNMKTVTMMQNQNAGTSSSIPVTPSKFVNVGSQNKNYQIQKKQQNKLNQIQRVVL